MIESTGFLARILGISPGAKGHAGPLAGGSTVRAQVISQLGPGTWQLRVAGRLIRARVQVPLQPGQEFLATVERRGGEVLLRQQHASGVGGSLSRLLSSAGVPQDALAVTLVQHLVHTQQALDPQQIARLHRLAQRLGLRSRREVRLLAVLAGKGLTPESREAFARFADELELDLGSEDEADRDRSEEQSRDHSARDGSTSGSRHDAPATSDSGPRRDGASDGPPPKRAEGFQEGDMASVVADLTGELSAWLRRRDSEPRSLLQVFNHFPDAGSAADPQKRDPRAEGRWLSIPLRLDLGGETRSAVLRIYRHGTHASFTTAALEVELADRRISFSIRRHDGAFKLTVYPADQDRQRVEARASELEQLDALLEVVVAKPEEEFDGFSWEDLSAIVFGVDTDV